VSRPPSAGAVFEFQCRADEYLEARRAAVRVRPFEYWLNRAWGPTLVILGLVTIVRDALDPSGYLVAAVGVALVLNGTLWLRRWARVEWRTTPRLGYRTWLGIGDAGLRLTTVDGDADVPWSTITHVVETPNTFTLCRAPDDFEVIPKRAFTSERQLTGFRARLAAECGVRPRAGR
jgi:YcxB-like protein